MRSGWTAAEGIAASLSRPKTLEASGHTLADQVADGENLSQGGRLCVASTKLPPAQRRAVLQASFYALDDRFLADWNANIWPECRAIELFLYCNCLAE